MIKLKGINKVFNPNSDNCVHALRNVDLHIHSGEMVAITGPSGSGKSTLLHVLAGIEKPTSGQYFFNNKSVADMSDSQRCGLRNSQIAIILQRFGLLGNETVLRNVCLPQIINGTYNHQTVQRAKAMLSEVGLGGLHNKLTNQLSGGQQQRVAIARALAMNAKLILADEPTGALDSKNTDDLMKLVQKVNQKGVTVLIVTHNPNVADCCNTHYHIVDGEVFKY
jgi:putative ABC transport system ATP-binding protein